MPKPAGSPLAPSSVYAQGSASPCVCALESLPPLVDSMLLAPRAFVHQAFVSVARMSVCRELPCGLIRRCPRYLRLIDPRSRVWFHGCRRKPALLSHAAMFRSRGVVVVAVNLS
jgi:hypothetical protein